MKKNVQFYWTYCTVYHIGTPNDSAETYKPNSRTFFIWNGENSDFTTIFTCEIKINIIWQNFLLLSEKNMFSKLHYKIFILRFLLWIRFLFAYDGSILLTIRKQGWKWQTLSMFISHSKPLKALCFLTYNYIVVRFVLINANLAFAPS
jgi:hypothetical protein